MSDESSIPPSRSPSRALERHLRAVFESAADGIWITSADGTILDLNPAALARNQLQAEEVIGRNVQSIVDQGVVDRSATLEVLKRRRQVSFVQQLGRTGQHLLVTGIPVLDAAGEIEQVVVFERDVTDLKNMRQVMEEDRRARRKAQEELSELNLMELADREIVAESKEMRQALSTCLKLARSEAPVVLILGESGTGKELVARTIHALSRRGSGQLVSVNCTAIPDQILESELFGHVKGAFTGADQPRPGLFLAANGSSLHLDEIGDLPSHLQPKLLRALEEGEVRPVGGSENVKVDVRILASTNQRLEPKVASGAFREDLYYRLNVLTVHVPALRERPGDIPILAMHYIQETCRELAVGGKEITPDALAYLSSRAWPGNVRELLNFVRRLVVFCRGPVVTQAQVRLLDAPGGASPSPDPGLESYKQAKHRLVDDFTRSYMQRLLDETGGNVSQAARLSGLERVSLQKILRRLGMDAEEFRGKDH